MPSLFLEYRLRIRNASDSSDVLVVSSVRGDTLPYLVEAPRGDGAEFDPFSGAYRSGSTTFRVADAITSGTNRVVTQYLEDAQFRQQLGGRPAYGEERVNGGAWVVTQAGIVTALRLASPAVWEIDVGDTTRATRNLSAFAPKRDAVDSTISESLGSYIARWPQRGALAGGPIIGDFLGVHDRGGWEMVVDQVLTNSAGKKLKRLTFKGGYAPPGFGHTDSANAVRSALNAALGDRKGEPTPSSFPLDLEPSSWPDVVVQVGGAYFAAASGLDASRCSGTSIYLAVLGNQFMQAAGLLSGFYVWDTANVLPVSGTVQRVRVFDALPSARSPIYFTGHPLALWTKLCDDVGLRYDSAGVTAVTNAIGSDRRISLRITQTESWSSFVESTLYGPTGYSVRTKAGGSLVPFSTRLLTNTPPTRTITSADVPQDVTTLFELSEPDAITKVTVSQTNLVPSTEHSGDADTGATDGVLVQDVSVVRVSGDGGGTIDREQTYSIPGFLHTAGTQAYSPAIVDAMALEIFDRASRGRLSGTIVLLRGGAGDGTVLGEELIVEVPALPNHNKRLGDDGSVAGRVMQVVRITPSPQGATAKLLDSGANEQTVPTVPTLSLAAGYGNGAVLVTITNAATLNAAGYGARLQWAVTSGGAPTTGQYTDVGAYLAGQVPTSAITLPAITPGQTLYARARSEQPRVRPSNYGTAVSIGTSGIAAPTSLNSTPDATDGSHALLTWTVGAASAGTDIFVRLQSDPSSADVRVATVLPGSTGYPMVGLTPGTAYTASVQHRAANGELSTKTTVSFSAGSASYTLSAPTSAAGIVGDTGADGVPVLDGEYGLDVYASEFPGQVEFLEAVETGVGTGAYGTPVTVAFVASVSGGPTSWRNIAPRDGLRRSLTARHARTGATTSASTTAAIVNPWGTIQQPAPPATAAGPSLNVSGVAGSPYTINYTSSGGTPTLKINGVTSSLPASPFTVARPAAGALPLEYAISITAGGQTVSDSVTVMPIDWNTVTPDLNVVPSAPATGEQSFTVTATDPSGGAVPPTWVLLRRTTGYTGGGSAIADGVEFGITSTDNVIHVYRPAFDTIAQSSAQFRATISGAGSEKIQRSIMNQVKTTFGPTLDVVGTAGSPYTIAYTSSGGTPTLKINGSASSLPASPFTVARPAAGGTPLEYAISITADGQTISDSVTVQPIDKDTVTPDLVATPSVPTATEQRFTVTATDPSGGAVPPAFVLLRGTTGMTGGGSAISDGVEFGITSTDNVIHVTRPAFDTVAQASAQFRSTITGAGTEVIQRSIANQVKTTFGPSLEVTPTSGALTYSIGYTGTPTLKINGSATALPGTNPFSVTRPAAGSPSLEYAFTTVADGQTVTDSVTVLPIDKDTITPDLAVVPSTPTATTQDFSPTATNPSGGGTPGVYVIVRGTTATSAGGAYTYSDGVEYAFASSGAVLTVARPAFGTTAQASVQFRATIAGAGQETIQRSIPNQVKTSFGPSLVVTPGALTSTALSIAYSGTYDTLTLAINGVPSTLPASPISVTLASTAGTYTFTATKDGVSNTQTIAIPAAGSASAPPLFSSLAIGVSSYALDQLALSWSSSGAPSGATFNVTVFEQTGITNTSVGNSATFAGVTSPYTYQCTNDIDAAGTRNKTFRFSVEMVSGSTVAGASTTVSQVVLSNT
jgi:hypothetical protein